MYQVLITAAFLSHLGFHLLWIISDAPSKPPPPPHVCFHRKLLVSLRRALISGPGVWQVQQVLLGIGFLAFFFEQRRVRTGVNRARVRAEKGSHTTQWDPFFSCFFFPIFSTPPTPHLTPCPNVDPQRCCILTCEKHQGGQAGESRGVQV